MNRIALAPFGLRLYHEDARRFMAPTFFRKLFSRQLRDQISQRRRGEGRDP
jgi:hypothetical protein